jgi:hypothetical protein
MQTAMTTGSFWFFYVFDVCEVIDLDALRRYLGIQRSPRDPAVRPPSPEYVRFEREPATEQLSPVVLENGERLRATAEYYDYGVISIAFQLPFAMDWPDLVGHSSRLRDSPEVERQANRLAKDCFERAKAALVKPLSNWLSEDYYVVHVSPDGASAAELMKDRGTEIAQIVRGEQLELAPGEIEDVLRSGDSYYTDDLLVVGWTAAFLYDTAEGVEPVMQLLQYANTQLLEYRYYDTMLTAVLAQVHRTLDSQEGVFARWRMATEAKRLNRLRLEVRELSERADTSIKFLSDMYLARVYRLAAEKVGADDYRRLVDNKLQTAADLYQFLMDEFHGGRAFVLELIVVIILVIELVFLFRGQK